MTLVKRLVEMHGGSIAAYSEGPGLGSEFVIHLPMHAEIEKRPLTESSLTSADGALPS